MACGDKFHHLAMTSDGYTLENRYGSFAVPGDYSGWRALAHRILTLTGKRYHQLASIEASRADSLNPLEADENLPQWMALNADYHDLAKRVDELPSVIVASLTGAGITSGIDQAAGTIADTLCFLEKTTNAIESYGETPVPLTGGTADPKKTPGEKFGDFGGTVLGLAIGGGIIYGVYLLTRGDD